MGYLQDYSKARFFGANDKSAKAYADTKRITNWLFDDKKSNEQKTTSNQSAVCNYNQNYSSHQQNTESLPKKETVEIDYSTYKKLQVPVKFKYEEPNDFSFYDFYDSDVYKAFSKGKGFIGDSCIVKINSIQYEYLMRFLEKLFKCQTLEHIKYIYTVWVINSKLNYLKYFVEISNDYWALHCRIGYLLNTARLCDAIYDNSSSIKPQIKQEKKQLTPKQKELLEEFLSLMCKSRTSSELHKTLSLWINTTSLSFIKEVIPRTIRFHYWDGNTHIFNETRQFFYFFAQKNNLKLHLSEIEEKEILQRIPSKYYEKVGLSFPFWEEEKNPYDIPF